MIINLHDTQARIGQKTESLLQGNLETVRYYTFSFHPLTRDMLKEVNAVKNCTVADILRPFIRTALTNQDAHL